MKQAIKLLLCGIIIPLLFGCSKPLSREDAAIIIRQKYNLPYNETQDIQFTETQTVNYTIPFNYTAVGQDAYYDEYNNYTKRTKVAQKAKLSAPTKMPIFEALENEGLINYSIQTLNTEVSRKMGDISSPGNLGSEYGYAYGGTFSDFDVIRTYSHITTPTEKGKEFIVNNNQAIIATDEFGEVTGIIENKDSKSAIVNYTTKRTNITPFGRIAFNINEETYNKTATFIKYDDGWRIQ